MPYKVTEVPADPLDSEGFQRLRWRRCAGSHAPRGCSLEVLANGETFYEAPSWRPSGGDATASTWRPTSSGRARVTQRFLEALTERAARGRRCNVVLDAIGAFTTWDSYLAGFRAAGGRVCSTTRSCWYTLPRINNRTHRELLVVDGTVGFVGGAGFRRPLDVPARPQAAGRAGATPCSACEGKIVRDLQSVFAENWLESSGEPAHRSPAISRFSRTAGRAPAMVVCSTPTTGRSARNRMVYQTLLRGRAPRTIEIATPYFLPDRSACAEMVRAIQRARRGGDHPDAGPALDHLLTRRASRRLYGPLLRAGARIYEYRSDDAARQDPRDRRPVSVVGSNQLRQPLVRHQRRDQRRRVRRRPGARACRRTTSAIWRRATRVTYRKWYRRPLVERVWELLGWLLERQQ